MYNWFEKIFLNYPEYVPILAIVGVALVVLGIVILLIWACCTKCDKKSKKVAISDHRREQMRVASQKARKKRKEKIMAATDMK